VLGWICGIGRWGTGERHDRSENSDSGTLELRWEGVNLVVDSEGGVVLASVFGTVRGVIKLAE